jgi:hypothetical protein
LRTIENRYTFILPRAEGWSAGLVQRNDLPINHSFIGHRGQGLDDGGVSTLKSLSLRDRKWTRPPVLIATARSAALLLLEVGYRDFVIHISEDDLERYAMRTMREASIGGGRRGLADLL